MSSIGEANVISVCVYFLMQCLPTAFALQYPVPSKNNFSKRSQQPPPANGITHQLLTHVTHPSSLFSLSSFSIIMNSIIAKLLADPTSTTDATSERHLAVALGYPTTWRVRRRILAKYSRYTDRGDAENSVDPPAVHSRDSWVEDVIYAGNPDKGVDRWYNHEAAMVASLTSSNNNPYQFKGGQLTKMIAKFTKGDAVEVKYGRKWFASTIEKRKEFPEGFK